MQREAEKEDKLFTPLNEVGPSYRRDFLTVFRGEDQREAKK